MAMQNPPHPGGIVKRQCLEPLGLTVTRAAEGLGVTRQALPELVNERRGVLRAMAIRPSKAFDSMRETSLGMQMAYDHWQARGRARGIAVEPLRRSNRALVVEHHGHRSQPLHGCNEVPSSSPRWAQLTVYLVCGTYSSARGSQEFQEFLRHP